MFDLETTPVIFLYDVPNNALLPQMLQLCTRQFQIVISVARHSDVLRRASATPGGRCYCVFYYRVPPERCPAVYEC